MDNYFILSSKVGDKWTKVASNMTSVKLGTCIHIMGNYLFEHLHHHSEEHPYHHSHDDSYDHLTHDSFHHSVIQ